MISDKIETLTQRNLIADNIGVFTHIVSDNNASLHKHVHYEIILVLSGQLTNIVNNHLYILNTGDCVIMPPNYSHELSSEQCLNRDIIISTSLFESIVKLIPEANALLKDKGFLIPVNFSINELMEIENLAREFSSINLISNKRCFGIIICTTIINKFLSTIYKTNVTTSHSALVKKICDDLNKELYIQGGIKKILQDNAYSKSHILHSFKKEVGINLTEYIKNVRLNHIAYYLKTTNYSLRDICNLVGIESLAYVNKIFKQKYNTTPMRYRKGL